MASFQVPFGRWNVDEGKADDAGVGADLNAENEVNAAHGKYNSHNKHGASSPHHSRTLPLSLPASDSATPAVLLWHRSLQAQQTWLFVGLPSGLIYKWQVAEENGASNALTPQLLMAGHRAPIVAMAVSRYRTDCTGLEREENEKSFVNESQSMASSDSASLARSRHHSESRDANGTSMDAISYVEVVVSADAAGEVAVWNCHDGRCLLHNLRAVPVDDNVDENENNAKDRGENLQKPDTEQKPSAEERVSTNMPTSAAGNAHTPTQSSAAVHTIAISPNCEYCVLATSAGRLIVLRLATLETVQVVQGSGITAAGFILPDAQAQSQRRIQRLDFLTVHARAVLARQFDQHAGRFVGADIAPPTPVLPKAVDWSAAARLLRPSPRHPGLAAVVDGATRVWIVDFLQARYVAFALDFPVAGMHFLRHDVLVLWGSSTGQLAFYQATLVDSTRTEGTESLEPLTQSEPQSASSSPSKPLPSKSHSGQASQSQSQSQSQTASMPFSHSPVLGSVVHKLDLVVVDETGELISLAPKDNGPQPTWTGILDTNMLLQVHGDSGCKQVAYDIDFDPQSPERTVHLRRIALPRELCILTNATLPQKTVTCMAALEPDLLVKGLGDGRIAIDSIYAFFAAIDTESSVILSPPSPVSTQPVLFLHVAASTVVSGNAAGTLVFWTIDLEQRCIRPCGWTRAHYLSRILGVSMHGPYLYSWSDRGHLAVHGPHQSDNLGLVQDPSNTHTIHTLRIFDAPALGATINQLLWKTVEDTEFLVIQYARHPSVCCNLTARQMATLEEAQRIVSHPGSCVVVSGIAREAATLLDGVVTVGGAREWPWSAADAPTQPLIIDVRRLIAALPSPHAVRLGKTVLAQLLLWRGETLMHSGADAAFASEISIETGRRLFGSAGPCEALGTGLVGANGNVSLLTGRTGHCAFWTVSPTATAAFQLLVLALLSALPWEDAQDAPLIARIATFYAAQLGNGSFSVATTFRPAAFSFVSKYWQDPQCNIQHAARIVFSATLAGLTRAQRTSVLQYWQDYLPEVSGTMPRSAVILAIIGCQEPSALSTVLRKHVAEALVALLLEDRRGMFRMAAVELIGRGYSAVWRPFVHGGSMVRLLWGWLAQLVSANQHHTHPYKVTLGALVNILVDDLHRTEHISTWLGEWHVMGGTNAAVSTGTAPGAATNIAAHSVSGLDVLRALLDSQPTAAIGFEASIVDQLLRLAASEPDRVTAIDAILAEMESLFGTVARSSDSRRTVVASGNTLPHGESVAYVYANGNVNANITHTLIGHVHPITTLALPPPDGSSHLVLSYSFEEACCRWWSLAPGGGASTLAQSIFGSLLGGSNANAAASSSSQGVSVSASGPSSPTLAVAAASPSESVLSVFGAAVKPLKTAVVLPELTQAIECLPPGSLARLNPLHVRWHLKAKAVELVVGTDTLMTLSIPA